jgi:KUP system potassium uptake protein
MLYPMVALATLATVIASQALISGAFSLTRQAVQMGYMPRVTIVHTSAVNEGQIYIPEVNVALMLSCLSLVLVFRESSALAAAYGIAVTGTMGITSVVYFVVLRKNWGWSLARALPLLVLFLAFDLPFFLANALKFFEGGWFPIVIGLAMYALMTTWKRGREMVAEKMSAKGLNLTSFLDSLMHDPPHRVSGTAVFLVPDAQTVPNALLHNLLHNQVLHERIVFLTVRIEDVPRVAPAQRVQHEDLRADMHRITLHFGFKEEIDVPDALAQAGIPGLDFVPMQTSYFLGRETILPTPGDGMALWRERLFAMLARNAGGAADYFRLPANRVIELGTQLEI